MRARTAASARVGWLPALMFLALGCGTTGKQVVRDTSQADSPEHSYRGDTVVSQAGDDEVHGTLGNDVIEGGPGADVLHGNQGDDRLEGGPGADVLHGDQGDDRLEGGPGADVLHGDQGNDVLVGGPGVDTLIGGAGADRLIGGPGADRFVFSVDAAQTGVDTIEDFRVEEGDVAVVAGIDVAGQPIEDKVRIVEGTLEVFANEVSRWLPIVRLGPVELSVEELVKRKVIVPRISVDF